MRRRVVRISLVLLILIVLLALTIQVILWTDIPRNLAIKEVQKALGLQVQAESLSTGWFGNSTLRDVTLTLPMADESFVKVAQLDVSHTSLIPMMLRRKIDLEELEFHKLDLVVLEKSDGTWNVQEAMQLIARAGGSKQTETASRDSVRLPAVKVIDGIVRIVGKDARETIIQPLTISGTPQGALVWKYDVKVPGHLDLTGEVAPGGDWKHKIEMTVQQIEPWTRPWVEGIPADAQVSGAWSGNVSDGKISGRLDLKNLSAGGMDAQGVVVVEGNAAQTTLRPEGLQVRTGMDAIPEMSIQSGRISVNRESITADDVQVFAGGGRGRVGGNWRIRERAGLLDAQWENVALVKGITQNGKLNAEIASPWPGTPHVNLTLQSSGTSAPTDWNADIRIAGKGDSWRAMQWELTGNRLIWTGAMPGDISNLTARLTTRDDSTITLDTITIPGNGTVSGKGTIDLENRQWWLWMTARDWTVPGAEKLQVAMSINAWGDARAIEIKDLVLRSGELDVWASGQYIAQDPKPLGLNVYFAHREVPDEAQSSDFLRGRLRGEGRLAGTVAPVQLDVSGRLFGRNLYVRDRSLGDANVAVTGVIASDRITLQSDRLNLLGGHWTLNYDYPIGLNEVTKMVVTVDELPVREIVEFFQWQDTSGTVRGRWTFDIPAWELRRIQMQGDVQIAEGSAQGIALGDLSGPMTMRDGVLLVGPINATKGAGTANGQLSINMTSPEDRQKLDVRLATTNFPITFGHAQQGNIIVTSQLGGIVDLATKSANGSFEAKGQIVLPNQPRVEMDLGGDLLGRVVDVKRLNLMALDASADGSMRIDLDQPLQSTGEVHYKNLTGSVLAAQWPKLDGIEGTFAGNVRLAPSIDPREPNVLKLEINADPTDGTYRKMRVGNSQAIATLDKARVVIDSNLQLAGGTAKVWARFTDPEKQSLVKQLINEPGGTLSQFNVDFQDLQLDDLVHVFNPKAEKMAAKISGSLTLLGSPRERGLITGGGTINVAEADLANSDIVAAMYNLMNIMSRKTEGGRGSIELRLEASKLEFTRIYFFDRGVEVRGAGVTIDDIWNMPESPIAGYLVGSIRPLKDIRLPIVADVGEIFSALQESLTPLKLSGTVAEPTPRPAPLGEITDSLKQLILGDVKR